ncbi:NapC/NirT family cytochrome c [Effusibacillus lacus]|uniref:Uncharacterized protein n=1 Tax=Effusibacillus lacus TaxID=1348429 RepID=A0A292YRH0_9BACL|nr:NapC/NirT family cytochrome c [Effusibacillus lacus]TCS76128.1 nitrate/TMAO reductase-like tetraheme cytochrome c subunit [Effusibacillus lacus]GAX91363.1 hypothetical protein EFBL_3032 [Effusibacillus lacus]
MDRFMKFLQDKFKYVLTAGFILFFAIAFAASLGTAVTLDNTVKPKVCASCHSKLTVAQGLSMSSHAKFSCTTCHTKAGFSFTQGNKVVPASATTVNPQDAKVDGKIPVKNEVCEKCHSMNNRVVSPSSQIKIPHPQILAKGVQCVQCHEGVMHGQREERGQGVISFKGPRMPTCIKCHIERGLSTKCSTCHLDDKKPESHKNNAWVAEGEHGRQARKDVGVCSMCHSFTKDKAVVMGKPGMEAAEFARSNHFCSNCHMNKKPPGHSEIWPIVHKAKAIPNRAGCLTCHNEEKPKPEDRAVQSIYCFKCHQQEKHPADWRNKHPIFVKTKGITEGKCFNCHASNSCATCHKANNVRQLTPEQIEQKANEQTSQQTNRQTSGP